MNLRDQIDAFGTSEGVALGWESRSRATAPAPSQGRQATPIANEPGSVSTYTVHPGKAQHEAVPLMSHMPTVIHVHEQRHGHSTVHESKPGAGMKQVFKGPHEKVAKFLKSKYGINHQSKQFKFKQPKAPKSARPANVHAPFKVGVGFHESGYPISHYKK